ncbi:DUF4199 domain-containing protein [Niabella ginsengisoli]|uniref:DUF4199 domain-containing protein n=1 Tax=Niabella ginsengisoli TaxID=522298 RepID=A0ABS9SG38_9BACT|nr:DUF4199 domain-containing protein [Niabella ginsengisoli]MCH5597314.1 DUF4199 domain-containing protein [Niabella ginsengisoli]
MKISSTVKGLITGLLMVAAGLVLYLNKVDETSPVQYIGYLIYGLGIVWAITAFVKKSAEPFKFGALFNQGFRCFVVVTLIMALFTLIFYKVNTHIIEEKAALTKQELLKTEKNRTPQEIDTMIESGKKNFAIMAASGAIFQYLFIGVVVTMATAGSLYLRNKKS